MHQINSFRGQMDAADQDASEMACTLFKVQERDMKFCVFFSSNFINFAGFLFNFSYFCFQNPFLLSKF